MCYNSQITLNNNNFYMTIEDKIIKSVSDYLKRDATDKDLKQVNQVIPENNRRQSKIYFKGKLIAKI